MHFTFFDLKQHCLSFFDKLIEHKNTDIYQFIKKQKKILV